MSSPRVPKSAFLSSDGDMRPPQPGLWTSLYAHRDSWAAMGTAVLGSLIVAAGQLPLGMSPVEPRVPTAVELIELPPPLTTEAPPPPPPVPRPAVKPMPVPQVPQIAVARAPLPETAQTVSVPEAPREMPNAKASPTPATEPAKAVDAPAKPTAEAAPAPRSNPAAEGSYQSGARAGIEKQKRYPEEALQMNMSGVVTVVYVISREGRLIRTEVEKSSGYSLLDRAALDAVRRARFDPIPADAWIGSKEQTFRTRIEFSIN